jgi:hypothetical protein
MSDADRLIKAMRAGGVIRISVEQAMPSGLAGRRKAFSRCNNP